MQSLIKNKISLKPLWAATLSCLMFALPQQAKAADFIDYFSGCITSMGAGLAGTAYANTKLNPGDKISATGYAISGGISCLAGMAFVGIVSSQAEFNATWKLKLDNENLTFQRNRLSKELCLLKETCEPGGKAIIIEEAPTLKKQGDKVFETTTSIIETNE